MDVLKISYFKANIQNKMASRDKIVSDNKIEKDNNA